MSGQPTEIGAVLRCVKKMLEAFVGARRRWNLAPDEALIFLALGRAGLSSSSAGVTITPVPRRDLSRMLNIPKETVRRKTARLVEIELATATTRGILIKNVDAWRELAEAIAG
jgi:hypothetical protein